MHDNREISHYLYPLNPKSREGYMLQRGRKLVSTSRKDFFETLDYDILEKWGVSKNANKIQIGDLIWVHFALPHSELGAVGSVEREAKWQPQWGRNAIWIRWDKGLTEKLKKNPIPFSAYQQVPQFSATTAKTSTAKVLNRWLATKRTPEAKSRDEKVRFRTAEVEQRVGQPEFRADLLLAYGNRCAVSGCETPEVLQAAHIQPVRSSGSHSVRNGILLRADLHNLFDRGLLTISEKYQISIDPHVRRDTTYKKFHGKKLQVVPKVPTKRPSKTLLQEHLEFHARR